MNFRLQVIVGPPCWWRPRFMVRAGTAIGDSGRIRDVSGYGLGWLFIFVSVEKIT